MQHPAEDVLRRFSDGTASRSENREVVRHLLSRCPTCAAAVRSLFRAEDPLDPSAYDPALSRLVASL